MTDETDWREKYVQARTTVMMQSTEIIDLQVRVERLIGRLNTWIGIGFAGWVIAIGISIWQVIR